MFFFFNFDNSEVPSFDQMMKPVLMALDELGGSATVRELDERAMDLMGLPDRIRKLSHKDSPNRTEVAYRLAWTN